MTLLDQKEGQEVTMEEVIVALMADLQEEQEREVNVMIEEIPGKVKLMLEFHLLSSCVSVIIL